MTTKPSADRLATGLTMRSNEYINRLVAGLVRGCEMLEQNAEKYTIWDDEVRDALESARSLGWGGPPPPNMATKGGNEGIAGRSLPEIPLADRIDALELAVFGAKRAEDPNYPQAPKPPPSLMEMVHELWRFTGSGWNDHQINKASLSTTIFEMVEARIAREREHVERNKQRRSPRGRLQALLWWGHSRLYPRPGFRDAKPANSDSVEGIFSDAGNGSLS